MTVRPFDEILRDFVIPGVPASGPHHPYKPDFRDSLNALIAGPFPDNRVIKLNNANTGTANNIVVSASVAIPVAVYQVLYILNVTQENTGPVTVSGAINRALVTNTNAPVPTGYLAPGMAVLCVDTGSALRMLSYGDNETIVRDAEAAQAAAEAARDMAANYANDALSGGMDPGLSTFTAIAGLEIPAGILRFTTGGYAVPGDGGGGDYVKVATEPTHAAKAQSADGAWWEWVGDQLNPRVIGGKGDGSDETAILAATQTVGKPLFIQEGDTFKTTDELWNLKGLPVLGPGEIVLPVTIAAGETGDRQINHIVREDDIISGRQYLFLFHNRLINRLSSTIVMSGDSTTQATGTITDVENFSPTGMLTQLAFRKGFSRIAMNNRGFGGKTTRQWVDDYLNDDIALNPDLYIIRWGINDPINGRSPEQTISDLREGLFNFRSSANGSFDACTVVLMMPNIVGYITGGADETWIEKIRSGYRQAAFDFGCIFVDTPRLAPDAKRGSGRWMDDLGFLQAVHPRDVMNVWLFSQLADELWPTGLLHFSDTAIKNNTALLGNPRLKTDLPDTYKTGISIEFGNTTSGWFDSVILTTIKQSDGPCLQFINTYGAGPLGFVRIADSLSNAWTAITPLTPQDTNLIPASGFNLGAGANTARLTRNGNHVQLDGWFTMNDPTTLSAGVTIGSVPLGYRPTGNVLTSVVISNGSGSYEIIPATVELNGDVVARKNSTLSASVIAVQPIAFSTASIV